MTTILKQVANMRDNTYHLQRHIWNDVQEDWPFYTEQERTMLRRRKPQNLTPPGSSDGSSGTHLSQYAVYIREHKILFYFIFFGTIYTFFLYIFTHRQWSIAQFHPCGFTADDHSTPAQLAEQ